MHRHLSKSDPRAPVSEGDSRQPLRSPPGDDFHRGESSGAYPGRSPSSASGPASPRQAPRGSRPPFCPRLRVRAYAGAPPGRPKPRPGARACAPQGPWRPSPASSPCGRSCREPQGRGQASASAWRLGTLRAELGRRAKVQKVSRLTSWHVSPSSIGQVAANLRRRCHHRACEALSSLPFAFR